MSLRTAIPQASTEMVFKIENKFQQDSEYSSNDIVLAGLLVSSSMDQKLNIMPLSYKYLYLSHLIVRRLMRTPTPRRCSLLLNSIVPAGDVKLDEPLTVSRRRMLSRLAAEDWTPSTTAPSMPTSDIGCQTEC